MLGLGETDLIADAMEYIDAVRPSPVIEGEENIPATGPFCAVANHYERRGLWIGFPSSLLVAAVARRRPGEPPLHIAVVDQTRLWEGRVPVPGTRWAYRRVAVCYAMVTIPARESDTAGRAAAMRRLARLALAPPRGRGEPICFYPEGEAGTASGMTDALPGTGAFLALLGRAGVPILPVGFAEVGDRLLGRIGRPFSLSIAPASGDERDRMARRMAMERIAALVPADLRGPYAEPT